MSSHVLSDVFKTVILGLSLAILPWVFILSIAALWSRLEKRLRKQEPPSIHFPHSAHFRNAELPKAA